ncbi:Upstream stimulatory factor 1 [Coemansia erecta]|uniref:Upstream stimulatory factor 1 n=1 Tax=Coemansia erecta TaxID=147472 RepID=A0A9W7Y055_9FUNG|nr:Upstream stimulatory factor 1 [Coemansia erecta]
MSHSASTSPIVPPGVRALQGTYSRQLTAEEKEMKRKVSHSAIEKRRRERTNAVLRELQEIVPGLSKPGKIQKLEILEAAADYIRQLTSGQKAHMHKSSKHGRRHNFQPHPYRHYEYQPHPRDEHNERTHFDMPQSHSVDLGRVVSEELSTSQPTAMATPLSECTNAPTEDARSSPPTDDPSSMKVNFLLC